MDSEDRFTRANSFCPHPEYWHSPDSEATETEVSEFIGALVRIIQPEFVVETGTYHGHTTETISTALEKNGHGKVVSIEKDRLAFEEAMRFYIRSNTTILNMNSLDYTPEQNIDFAFFDSWQEGRYLEFLRFYNLGRLKTGAIVAFHDSAPHHQVFRLVKDHLIEPGYISTIQFFTPRGLLLGQVIK